MNNVRDLCENLITTVSYVTSAVDNVIDQVDALAKKCATQISEIMGKLLAHGEEPFLLDDEYIPVTDVNKYLNFIVILSY